MEYTACSGLSWFLKGKSSFCSCIILLREINDWNPRKWNTALATNVLFEMPPKWCFLNCWTLSKSAFHFQAIMDLKAVHSQCKQLSHFILLHSFAIPLVVDWSLMVLIYSSLPECTPLGNALQYWLWLQSWPYALFWSKSSNKQDLKSACTLGLFLFPFLESWVWQAWTSLLDDKKHIVQLSYQPRWQQANWHTWNVANLHYPDPENEKLPADHWYMSETSPA